MARIKRVERENTMETTRLRLLDAAADEFARAGCDGANINTISTSAGYAKGTVYNYFPSKRALLLALIDATARQHYEYFISQVRPEPDPTTRLECFYQAGFEFVIRNLSRSLVLFNTINGPNEELKAHLFEAYQPIFKFVAEEIIAPGIQQNAFRAVDPPSMAMLLMNIYLGTASQLNKQNHPWLDPLQVANLVIYGLRK